MTCLDPKGCGGLHPLCRACRPPRNILALRLALAAETLAAFALWPCGILDWGLAGIVGTGCAVALWCTFPEPHRAGEPSERLRVAPSRLMPRHRWCRCWIDRGIVPANGVPCPHCEGI
jgi:hypothetical protein